MSKKLKIKDYDTFNCIADKCSLTCCQEWRIGIDDSTYKKWKKHQIFTEVKSDDTGYYIKLKEDKKCPFLTEKKLCKIVIEQGEDYLSHTCTTFPRQINAFEERIEYSLDTGCPAVIDLIKDNKFPLLLTEEGKRLSNADALYQIRELILEILQDESYTMPERVMVTFYIVLDLYEKEKLTEKTVENYKATLAIKPIVEAIRSSKFNIRDTLTEANELFLDVVHNYRQQKLYESYLEPIALKAETLEEDFEEKVLLRKYKKFEEISKEHVMLLRNYMLSEVVANCLLPEMKLEDVVVGFQWIVLTYVTAKHTLFLKWLEQEEKTLTYEIVRDYLAVISRVMGYGPDDIREYLENSFEEVIWEWGYLALIVGNSSF